MFTIEQIQLAHSKIKSGADFPIYIRDIKEIGVTKFTTWVVDSHTQYFGVNGFQISSLPKYAKLIVADLSNIDKFAAYLKVHQRGETDYVTFCKHCAQTGVIKWIVDLDKMICTYYDRAENEILKEIIF